MNKQLTAFLIITSICMLAMKDAASLIHSLLHAIPDNPLHHHATHPTHDHHDHHTGKHKHRIDPMEIHKRLQHAHNHDEGHEHTHDLQDHMGIDDDSRKKSSLPQIKPDLKVDLFILTNTDYTIHRCFKFRPEFYSFYLFTSTTYSPFPPSQPPQQT